MPITFRVLGGPRDDNALFVRVETGQDIHRLLFDCGEGCPAVLGRGELQDTRLLFFSHLHMDHVAGFDGYFRVNAGNRVRVWGPPDTGRILHHRLRGVMWNLHRGMPGEWELTDLDGREARTRRYRARDAFEVERGAGVRAVEGPFLRTDAFTVEAHLMDHRTPSAAYVLREPPRLNVDPARLAASGLKPGKWLAALKDGAEGPIEVDGRTLDPARLRADLLTETPGDSLAYCTDFLLDDAALERLTPVLRGVTTLVCEAQYRAEDADLARENHHMTAPQVARLARAADVGHLVLFHVSDRYDAAGRAALLAEARAIFERSAFPEGW